MTASRMPWFTSPFKIPSFLSTSDVPLSEKFFAVLVACSSSFILGWPLGNESLEQTGHLWDQRRYVNRWIASTDRFYHMPIISVFSEGKHARSSTRCSSFLMLNTIPHITCSIGFLYTSTSIRISQPPHVWFVGIPLIADLSAGAAIPAAELRAVKAIWERAPSKMPMLLGKMMIDQ